MWSRARRLPCRRESTACFASAAHNVVKPRLTERGVLLRLDETLQQSVSDTSRRQMIAAAWGLLDAVDRRSNSLVSKRPAPLPAESARLRCSRVRPGRTGVLCTAVCDHRDFDRVFRKPGA